uniref:Putative methyltransferase n=1 Tax=Streptomyces tenjimariensis TaxID=29308 RepID=Q2UZA1_9ACTN|nr:putative methyltransferase [Streptomyces tenjimariensis]
MTSEHRGAAGPYIEYDGLPVLHATERDLPLIHPYAPVEAGRYVTPGGGRLTVRKAEKNAAHLRITLDHLGCPAQCTEAKDAAFRRLALAVEGYCVDAGCRHRPAFSDGVLRCFEVRNGAVALTAFVRAVLAIELGDLIPAGRIVEESEARFGPVRTAGTLDGEGQAEAG